MAMTRAKASQVTTKLAATGSTVRGLDDKLAEFVSVKDFGAVGDGVADDTAAIQAAINTGFDLVFPDGLYLVSSQLTIDTAGQQLTSLHPYPNEFGGAAINFTHDGVCIMVQQPQCAITNLRFVGPRLTADTAVKAARVTNTDDMDFAVTNCFFKTCTTAINCIGRALNANENLFANCDLCIDVSWPTSGTIGSGEQALPLGFRATRILDNRAHSCTKFMASTGADRQYLRGAVIDGNQLDIGERFFEGGIIDSVISNNVVELANTTIIYIDAGGTELTIIGNVLNGTDGDPSQSPARAIWFDTGSTPQRVTITGNTISYMDISCIRFTPAASDVSIVGNFFGAVGSSGIEIIASLSNATISANSFKPGTGLSCINATGATLTNCTVVGNTYTAGKTLIAGSPTDGGGNVNQTNGRLTVGSLGSATRTLEVTGTGSLPARLTRSGSSAGVGIEFVNTAGATSLFMTPTGTDTGSYSAGADNSVSSGTTTQRWSYVHAFNVRTHGVTVANLPAAATAGAGARAFVTDANATTFASIVAGGGANGVPVYSDGTNWRIG